MPFNIMLGEVVWIGKFPFCFTECGLNIFYENNAHFHWLQCHLFSASNNIALRMQNTKFG